MSFQYSHKIFIVSATGSGIGKTSITLGIIRCLVNRGYRVQPFKVGPDFLDPSWLSVAAKRPCCNLDSWMTSPNYVQNLVASKMENADIGIIEGVMGLYDGANTDRTTGSTAEIASILDVPVILVANAHGMSRSFAAMVNGFVYFPNAPKFAGVIANHSGSNRHREILDDCLQNCKLPPLLGSIPRNSFQPIPGRHLGLVTASSRNDEEDIINQISNVCEKNINIDILISSIPITNTNTLNRHAGKSNLLSQQSIRIGYALDEAFHFYYSDNLDLLRENGAELIAFSPLSDNRLPDSLDGLYFGGGYPEIYAPNLSQNSSLLDEILSFANSGKPIYAECGGLMYMSKSLKDLNNKKWNMSGVLPFETEMNNNLHTLGYSTVTLEDDCIIGKKGTILKGHEFHYSSIVDSSEFANKAVYSILYRNNRTNRCGYKFKNVLASYIHLHWGETPMAAVNFINVCRMNSDDKY